MELEFIDNDNVVKIFKKSNLIKFITLYDIINSIFYLVIVPFYGFAGIFCFIFSFIGFYGAKNLKKIYILIYLLYLLFQNIVRIGLFALILWNPIFFSINQITILNVVLNSIILIVNLFLNYYVFSLYKIIKDYDQNFLDLILKDPEYVTTVMNPV